MVIKFTIKKNKRPYPEICIKTHIRQVNENRDSPEQLLNYCRIGHCSILILNESGMSPVKVQLDCGIFN